MTAYYRAMEKLSERLLALTGEALENDPSLLSRFSVRHTTNAVAGFHGASSAAAPRAREMVSAHSDTGLLTLLAYGSSGMRGLELRDPSGSWLHVEDGSLPEGALLLNVGDMLHRLTNGRFLSTPHRVVERGGDREGARKARMALIFFFAPAYDALLEPVVEEGGEAKFDPVVAGRLTHNYL